MKKLEPYSIASALFYIFTILYVICIGVKLILVSLGIEGLWHMHKIWEVILPWFSGLDSLSIVIGLLEVSLGSYLIGYIIVPIYNLLTRKKVSEDKMEVKPIILRFKTLFATFAVYVSLLFTLCLIYDLIVPTEYQMLALWKLLLPGFTELTFLSYLIGLGVIVIYSMYTAFIFSKTLNYFEKSELKKSEENSLLQRSHSDKEFKMLSETKSRYAGKKYNAKYFGVAAGIFAMLIFILAVIKMFFSNEDYSAYLKPFIPFFDSVNAVDIIGGVAISFLWGWLIGYFFMVFYNWFDRKLNPRESDLQG
ncbi:MAG: hypothetical protein KJ666_16060 [Bacteroidetes bacterium]|nr:hypothetical protein [Bacteroidota bacterium]MBU2584177.1 hypothetical protein [Bacteroidota bacterium]